MHQGWGTRDANRHNRALVGRGMNQHRQGDSSVHYDETGRVVYQGRRRPDDTLPEPHRDNRRQKSQRRDGYSRQEPTYRDNRGEPRDPPYRDHSRGMESDYARGGGRPPYSDYSRGGRQYDNQGYRPEPQRYEQNPHMRGGGYEYGPRPYEDDYSETMDSRETDSDRIGPRLIGVTFIALGALLLSLAVVEVMLCLDHGYYCLFWAGALVFEFGMFTFIHNGDYHVTWKNVVVLTFGLLGAIAVHAAVALVMKPLAEEFIVAGKAKNNSQFETEWHKLYINETSHVSIDNYTQPWVCIGVNSSSMFVLMISFLVLTATALVANRVWREVLIDEDIDDNFGLCMPRLFNPYGQLSAAQALSFVGMVSVYGTVGTDWNDYWTPVWTAGLVAIAAITNVAALKKEQLLHLSGLALIFQVLSICGCVATVVLSTMALVDDVKILDTAEYESGFHRDHAIASGCLFALVDVVALVNSFYAVGLTVRLFDILYRSSPAEGLNEKRAYSEDESSYDDNRDQPRYNDNAAPRQVDPRWDYKTGGRY